MILRYRYFTTLLLLASIAPGSAQPSCAQDDAVKLPDFSAASHWCVTTTAGKKLLPQTLNVASRGWLLVGGDDVERLSSAEIFSITNMSARPPGEFPREAISRLYLNNGDRLVGQLVSLSEAGLELRPLAVNNEPHTPGTEEPAKDIDKQAATVLEIPLESVRALEWIPSGARPHQEKLLTFEDALNQDVLKLSNGDQLSGELTTIAFDSLEFRDDQGARTVPTSEVRAIFFNPELLLEPPAIEDYSRIALADGSLLTLTDLSLLDYNHFELKTVLAGSYRVPLEMLVSLSRFSKHRVPLTRRSPTKVNYTPFLASVPRWQVDRNVRGMPLKMAGGRYLTGIGVHSRTALTWPLENGDRRFLADIGIDDSTNGGGSVTFTVLLDNDIAFESGDVNGGELPRTIDINLEGKQTLTLLVDFGTEGDVLDRANWGHAVIVREQRSD